MEWTRVSVFWVSRLALRFFFFFCISFLKNIFFCFSASCFFSFFFFFFASIPNDFARSGTILVEKIRRVVRVVCREWIEYSTCPINAVTSFLLIELNTHTLFWSKGSSFLGVGWHAAWHGLYFCPHPYLPSRGKDRRVFACFSVACFGREREYNKSVISTCRNNGTRRIIISRDSTNKRAWCCCFAFFNSPWNFDNVNVCREQRIVRTLVGLSTFLSRWIE